MPDTTSPRLPMALATGASFLAFLDVTIANLAIPDLARDFEDAGLGSLSWTITLYTMVFAALLAPAGRLADAVGRQRLFAIGAVGFTVTSLAAALAPSLGILLAARAAQGASAALLLPASLAFVLVDTPPERRANAIGLWSAAAAVAAASGPPIGGLIVDVAGWRALFAVNVPIACLLAYGASRLPRQAPATRGVPDVLGTALLALGVGALVLALTEGNDWGWNSWKTLASLAASGALTGLALARSARHSRPAIEVDLWRNRTYAAANAVSLAFGSVLLASMFSGILFLTATWGYSTLEAGLAMTPGAIAAGVLGIGIARSRRRPSPRALILIGASLIGAACSLLAAGLSTERAFLELWLPAGLLFGSGLGAVSVGASSAAALSVAPERFATATGLNVAARQVGGAIGVAAVVLVLGDRPTLDDFRGVYAGYVAVSVLVAVAAMPVALAAAPPPPTPVPQEAS